ncbi:MAG: dihydropteroate synthase [Burkholderiales bacterium]|nr:dihydropteroate synthase [Burkholderiales bacterium]
MQAYFDCGRFRFPLGPKARPLVMGILNVTPDSFADGGRYQDLEFAIARAEQMLEDGVDIIDIGGESSRPGAQPLPLSQEMDRVLPVVYALRDFGVPLSVDTYKPELMREALVAGADMINDIHGFTQAGAVEAVATSDCGLCVMHMQASPQTMQQAPRYDDPVREVTHFLQERVQVLQAAGVASSRLSIDPGFGFGKNLEHNLALLRAIGQISQALELPVLAGMSRKSMLGQITGKPIEERLAASVAAHVLACARGARIVRVHDVAATVDAVKVWHALEQQD